MQLEVIPLFSTPVVKATVESNIDLKYLESLDYYQYTSGNGHGSVNQNILLEDIFKDLRVEIEKVINVKYHDILQFSQGKLTHASSWINLHKPGEYSQKHSHSNSCYSGVYYLNAPQNGGGLIFWYPQEIPTYCTITVSPEVKEMNMWNSKTYGFPLTKNDLFIFPSHLTHYTEVNRSNENRYCLAFNYFVEGAIGQNTGRVNLQPSCI